MAKYRSKEIVEAEPYQKGMEDGFRLICTSGCKMYKYNTKEYCEKCPNRKTIAIIVDDRGDNPDFLPVSDGDMIVVEEDGFKCPWRKEDFDAMYEPVQDE